MIILGVSGVTAGGIGPFVMKAPAPAGDRWMYPSNSTPGTRGIASTFSFLPFPGVDDRFGQFLIKFDTVAAGVPAGLGVDNYQIHQIVLTAVYASADSVAYDATEDPRASLGAAGGIPDPDPGRPLELHGTGFRGGFTAASFQETSPYGTRNAYANGFDLTGVARDVSNSVSLGYESHPWAIGEIKTVVDSVAVPREYVPLAVGAIIPVYAHVSFKLNLALPGVADYVRQGFNQGFLWFTLSSFHPVDGQNGVGFPAYFTRDHPEQSLFQDVAPFLDAEYSLPLQITAFQRDSAARTVSLTWNGSPGFQYIVEQSDNLGAGSWFAVGSSTTLTPAAMMWTGSVLSNRSFFRISRHPIP